jgi:hypothetical protein
MSRGKCVFDHLFPEVTVPEPGETVGIVLFPDDLLLKRLDQAILDVIDNPEKTQQPIVIGTLF